MKMTQAWGWLVAGVLAAGLNASYHNGGLQWAHQAVEQITTQVESRSEAVLALASGNADRFLAEARMLTARNEAASCPLATSMARVQNRVALSQARLNLMSAREEAQLARLEANRARMEAQVEAQVARIRIPAVAFNPVALRVPACPRIRVEVPRAPMVRILAPVIQVESGSGPI
jgi:PHD/YefM family antitoxin component YafN of YafNO toxin-antitoxin module